mgnify:CR=1 FL=1
MSDIWFICKIDIFQFVITIFDEVQRARRYLFVYYRIARARTSIYILLSDKNESYHFHTSWSTNKQGFGNLLRKTSPLIIKMWFKRNICRGSIYMGLIIREGGFLCRIVSPVSAEASSLALCRTPETMAIANPRWSERSEWNLGSRKQSWSSFGDASHLPRCFFYSSSRYVFIPMFPTSRSYSWSNVSFLWCSCWFKI